MSEPTTALSQTEKTVDLSEFTSYTPDQVELIKNTVCRGASDDELRLFLMVCKRTNLDPFVRQIHAVFRNVKVRENGKETYTRVMTIQTGIDGYRLISERTGKYIGQDPPQWCGEDGVWKDVWLSKDYPRAARAAIYKTGFDRPFVGIALWDEYVQTNWDNNAKKSYVNAMWSKMPAGQLMKCAEALAHRKAFPNETSHLYVKEELDQMDNDTPEDLKQIESPMGDYVVKPKTDNVIPMDSATLPEEKPAQTAPPAEPAPAEQGKRGRRKPQDQSAAPPPATQPPPAPEPAQTAQAPAETVPPTPKVEYVVYAEPIKNGALVAAKTEPAYSNPDVAIERATKLCHENKITTHVVMRVENGNMRQIFRTDTAPAAPPAATTDKPAATSNKTTTATTKRLNALAAAIQLPTETALARFNAFFCGYLDIPLAEMRKKAGSVPEQDRNDAMDALELVISKDVSLFNSGPQESGKQAALTVAGVKQFAGKQWTIQGAPDPACQVLSGRVALLWGFSLAHFEKWISNIGLDFMGPKEAEPFFRVCMVTPQRRASSLFIKSAVNHNLSMAKMLEKMEEILKKPLEEATETEAEDAISKVAKAVQEEASKPPIAAAPATADGPAPEPEELSGSLW